MVRKMKFAMPALALAFALAFTSCSNDIDYGGNWERLGDGGTLQTAAGIVSNVFGVAPANHTPELLAEANRFISMIGAPVIYEGNFVWTGRSEHQLETLVQWLEDFTQHVLNQAETAMIDRPLFATQTAEGTRNWTVLRTHPAGTAINHSMNFRRGVVAATTTVDGGRNVAWEIWYSPTGGMFENGASGFHHEGIIMAPGTVVLVRGGTFLNSDPAGTGPIDITGGGNGTGGNGT